MANNRLYIRDTETGEEIMLAKGYAGSVGWGMWAQAEQLREWLDEHDFDASVGHGATRLVLYDENHPPKGNVLSDSLRAIGQTEAACVFERLLSINESLRREISRQRSEIAALRTEQKILRGDNWNFGGPEGE